MNEINVIEGDSGTTLAQFTVELSTAAPVNVQFDYTTVDGEAIAGEDYLATSGQVTITPGQTTATVEVEIIGDTLQEPNESFALNLSGLSRASFDNLESEYAIVANIENDDKPVILYGDAGNDTLVGEEQNDLVEFIMSRDWI
jgi:Ca2+-binding RTX toxin-like protein